MKPLGKLWLASGLAFIAMASLSLAHEVKKYRLTIGGQTLLVELEEVHEDAPPPVDPPPVIIDPPPIDPPPIDPPPAHEHHSSIEVTPTHILTHHDRVPRFAVGAESVAVKSGLWSDSATWSKPPAAGSRVQIPDGIHVTYDARSTTKHDAIEVAGCLEFADDKNTELWATEIMVLPAGCLEVEPGERMAEVVFVDAQMADSDPGENGRGLLVFGELKIQGKPLAKTFVRMADASAGSLGIETSEPVDWPAGTEVVIPDTRHINPASNNYYTYEPQWEVRKVSAVNGRTITLDEPLAYAHRGPRDMDGTPTKGFDGKPLGPHVAALTRSVVFRSENPYGTRGHVQCFGDAQVSIRYAEFRELGRTKPGPLGPSNRIGRYSLHTHHLVGRPGGIDGHQFIIEGNSVRGGLKWGLTIHGSHYGLVRGNVVYDIDGAGIATENGAETGNVFEGNFVCRVNGHSETAEDIGDKGDGYWFPGPMNAVRNNVAANCFRSGFEITPESMPAVDNRYNRPVQSPISPLGELKERNLMREAVRDFSGNEVYGATEIGARLWSVGDRRMFPSGDASDVNTLRNCTFWHLSGGSFVAYYADTLKCDGWIHRSDPAMIPNRVEDGGAGNAWIGEALFNGGSVCSHSWLLNADVQGSKYGYFHRAHGFTDQTVIADVVLDNALGILIYPWAHAPGDGSSDTVYRDILFRDSYSPGSLRAIQMYWEPFSAEGAMTPETHTVLNYQRIAGLDLALYYHEQAPGARDANTKPEIYKGNWSAFPYDYSGVKSQDANTPALVPEGEIPKGQWAPSVLVDGDKGEAAKARGKALGIDGLVFVTACPRPLVFANVLLEDEKPVLHYAVLGSPDASPKASVEFNGTKLELSGPTGSLPLSAPDGLHALKVTSGQAVFETSVRLPVKR